MYKPKIFCIIILSVVCALFFTIKRAKTRTNMLYSNLLVISLIHLYFDIATVYTIHNMDTVPWLVNEIVHRFFIGTMLLVFNVIYKYIQALIESETKKPLLNGVYKWITLIMFWLSIIGVAALPLDYMVTKKGNYSYGPAANVLYISISVYIVLILKLVITYRKVIPGNKIRAIIMAFIAELLVSVYQFIFPTSLVSSLGIVILIFGFYLTVENPDAELIEKLKETTARADAANNAKTSFLANMSHEIRTPINAVLGMNELILRESNEQEIRNYAFEVKGAAKSLLGIINDILDITKIEAGKLTLIPVTYNLATLISDIYNMISFKAEAKKLEFNVIADKTLPSELIGDDIRLKQVLVNLLNNAVKYTHEGSVTLEVKLVNENNLYFCIKDTGIGIKQEDIDKLYIPFERIEEKRNRSIEGTGLGMSITLQLLSLMGSKLKVNSVYGKGSEFSFIISQKVVDTTPIDTESICHTKEYTEKPYKASYEAPDARILIVDDNGLNRKVFVNLLKKTKIKIDEAASGKECLKKITEKKYDIIFLDHMMPEMDGIQTFIAMKETEGNLCGDAPVIALTANAVTGARQLYFDTGFDAFLAKPVDPDILEKMVHLMLDKSLVKECESKQDTDTEKNTDKAKLPIINGVDWGYGMLHFRDQNTLAETVQMFISSINRDAEELECYYANINDEISRTSYRVKIHSMKSSAALIGIIQLSGMAMELENAARNGDLATLAALHPIFIKRWLTYSDLLHEFENTNDSKKDISQHGDELTEILAKIRCAAEEMDVDKLDALSKQLDEYHFDGASAEKIAEIKSYILNFEVEKLMEYDYSNC